MALTENRRYTVVLGPVKAELIHVTASDATEDTVTTNLQNGFGSTIVGLNGPTAADVKAVLSSKTITVTNPEATDYLITTWGF